MNARTPKMRIKQFSMAYSVNPEVLNAILPAGYASLRPWLRIDAEIREDHSSCLGLSTPVVRNGKRGWLVIDRWDDVPYACIEKVIEFKTDFLEISFKRLGVNGHYRAGKDIEGYFSLDNPDELIPMPSIRTHKEYCDCVFKWTFSKSDASGSSDKRPRRRGALQQVMPDIGTDFSAENVAKIPCDAVLGAFAVRFLG